MKDERTMLMNSIKYTLNCNHVLFTNSLSPCSLPRGKVDFVLYYSHVQMFISTHFAGERACDILLQRFSVGRNYKRNYGRNLLNKMVAQLTNGCAKVKEKVILISSRHLTETQNCQLFEGSYICNL